MALDLGKQVGPLPLGAWLAVVGGGLGIAYFMNKNAGEPEQVQLSESGVGEGGTPGWIDLEPPEREEPVEETNSAWSRKAIDWLILQGANPVNANGAINRYLNGESLDTRQRALVNSALRQFGSPPEGTGTGNPPGPKPDPKPKPKPDKPKERWPKNYHVHAGDSLPEIARKFYKDGRKRAWMRIYRANRGRIEAAARRHGKKSSRGGPKNMPGFHLYPGTHLHIPRPL